ncbi:MAG: hypothetical protein ACRDF8_12025, partial [Chloroflexota bacterium]
MAKTDADREWRELALLFLTRPVPGEPGAARPDLLVGALPADLPVEIPVPNGVRVRGSLASGQHVQVLLQSDLTQEEVGALYHDALVPAAWFEPDFPRPGGFMAGDAPEYFRTYCRGSEGPA